MRWQIGKWTADSDLDTIEAGAESQKLERRAMEVLIYLAERAGKVVSKDDLVADVWGRMAVSDHAIAMVISQLRRALGDDAKTPTYIETITKRGYRLVASASRRAEPVSATQPPAEAQIARPVRTPAAHNTSAWVGGVAVLLLAVLAFSSGNPIPATPPRKPPFVVTDFVNTTGLERLDHVAFAHSFHVAIALQQGDAEPVVRWRDDGVLLIADVKKALGVPAVNVVSGTIGVFGGSAVLRVQLRRAEVGLPSWSRDYALDSRSIDAVAAAVGRDIALAAGRSVFMTPPSRSFPPEAYDLFWRAYYARTLGKGGAVQARETLETLAEKYADYVPGRQLLALTYAEWSGTALGDPGLDTLAAARREIEDSKKLDGGVTAWTAFTEAWLSVYADRDLSTAYAHARHATQLNASSAIAWQSFARIASLHGKHDEALSALGKARRLDLANLSILADRAWVLYAAGRYDEAFAWIASNEKVVPFDHALQALIADARRQPHEAANHWAAFLRQQGITSDATPDATGSPAYYRVILHAMSATDRRKVGAIPLAAMERMAGDDATAAATIATLVSLQDDPWNLRAHQVHLLKDLHDRPALARIWLERGKRGS